MEKHFLKRKKEHINKHWLRIVKKYQIEDDIVITHDKISNKDNVLIYTTKNIKIKPYRGRIDYDRYFYPEYANKNLLYRSR